MARVSRGKNVKVFEEIKEFSLIEKVTPVYGKYDLTIETMTKNMQELNKFIYNVLRKTPHILMTTTMIVAKIPEKK